MKLIVILSLIFGFALANNTAKPAYDYGFKNTKTSDQYFVRKAKEQKENAIKQEESKK
ncbi:hypothetical protein [Helicobacter sp. 16-1353]|uniref:hypothetical protein n=1 Tax=Helicobacter sp. 16-1353 TaxID=2004996 RepID=UPI0015EE4DC4|nr:hypothetical protein [Helicobacter sp. 16-1353]